MQIHIGEEAYSCLITHANIEWKAYSCLTMHEKTYLFLTTHANTY